MFTSDHAHEAELANASELAHASDEDLHRAYIWSINSAIESGGEVLADELANSYRHESRELFKRRSLRAA
jgi:hypothetical protein